MPNNVKAERETMEQNGNATDRPVFDKLHTTLFRYRSYLFRLFDMKQIYANRANKVPMVSCARKSIRRRYGVPVCKRTKKIFINQHFVM